MRGSSSNILPFSPSLLRGVETVITPDELEARWKEAQNRNTPLRIKVGFDPTAPDLHLGHYVILRKLREFQECGHRVFLIIGDFTARIGDPSGRNETRPPLTSEEVLENAHTYEDQVFRVLIRERTEVLYNSSWLDSLSPREWIRMASLTTVARMLEREDFRQRFQEQKRIHLHEFLYPLLQGYDSVAIRADIEVGGRDQIFNLLMGRDLQKAYGQPEQIVLTLPLLVGLDGHLKMSKSSGNYVAFRDPPEEQYGKIMSIPDHLMWDYYHLLTSEPVEEIRSRVKSGELHPMEAKGRLAFLIVKELHGESEARQAAKHFRQVFQERKLPDEIPTVHYSITKGPLWIPHILKENKVVNSSREALRLLSSGAISVNGASITQPYEFDKKGEYLLKVGKRRFLRVIVH